MAVWDTILRLTKRLPCPELLKEPSQPLSLSIPSLGIYPSTLLDVDNAHRNWLFGYISLTASRGYQKNRRFDAFGDYDNDESERASTVSDASFYSVASSPGSPTSDEAESSSTFDSDSFSFPPILHDLVYTPCTLDEPKPRFQNFRFQV